MMEGCLQRFTRKQKCVAFEHQPLIVFLEEEAERRHVNLAELAAAMRLNPSQIYNLRSGIKPGLKVCLDIARYTNTKISFILYLAGHITEDEFRAERGHAPEIEIVLRDLEEMRGTPYYRVALKALMAAMEIVRMVTDATR